MPHERDGRLGVDSQSLGQPGTGETAISGCAQGIRDIYDAKNVGNPLFCKGARQIESDIGNRVSAWITDDTLDLDLICGRREIYTQTWSERPLEAEFGFYLGAFPQKDIPSYKKQIAFENRVTAVLIGSSFRMLEGQKDPSVIAALITMAQQVSNNRREARGLIDMVNADERYLYNIYRATDAQIKYLIALRQTFRNILPSNAPGYSSSNIGSQDFYPVQRAMNNIIADHFLCLVEGTERAKPISLSLMEAWYELVREGTDKASEYYRTQGDHEQYDDYPPQISSEAVAKDPSFYFAAEYFRAIAMVADLVRQKKHNGVVYLTDLLERRLGNRYIENANQDVTNWKRILLGEFAKDPMHFFDFLSPTEKVREIAGRYLDLFPAMIKTTGQEINTIHSLGFGLLGVGAWELVQAFHKFDQNPDVTAIDVINLRERQVSAGNAQVIEFVRRKNGRIKKRIIATPTIKDNVIPDWSVPGRQISVPRTRYWTDEERRLLVEWRNMITAKAIQHDLTTGIPPVEQADLVELSGTLGIFDDLRVRAKVIENAWACVKPGGYFLIRGGFSSIAQNCREICIQKRDDNSARVVFVVLSGDKKDMTQHFDMETPIFFDQVPPGFPYKDATYVSLQDESALHRKIFHAIDRSPEKRTDWTLTSHKHRSKRHK